MRWPATSSSSQARRRGQARASASCASSNVVLLGRDQPRADEQRDDSLATGVAEQHAARARGSAPGAPSERGRDEPQQDRAQRRPLLGAEVVVEPVGRPRDGAADAARSPGTRRP